MTLDYWATQPPFYDNPQIESFVRVKTLFRNKSIQCSVWRALCMHTSVHVPVVMKTFADVEWDEESGCPIRRKSEYLAWKTCNGHPNIIRLLGVIHENCKLHFIMEAMDGDLLKVAGLEQHAPVNRLSDTSIQSVFAHILTALDHMHQLGYAHRDVKAENIGINFENGEIRAVLLDFGHATNKLPFSGTHGTDAYEAPEVSDSGTFSYSADIYALGLCMAEMFAMKRVSNETPLPLPSPDHHAMPLIRWLLAINPCE